MSMTANHPLFPCHTPATAIPRRGSRLRAMALAVVALAVGLGASTRSSADGFNAYPFNTKKTTHIVIVQDKWGDLQGHDCYMDSSTGRVKSSGSFGVFTCHSVDEDVEWKGTLGGPYQALAGYGVSFYRAYDSENVDCRDQVDYQDYYATVVPWGSDAYFISGVYYEHGWNCLKGINKSTMQWYFYEQYYSTGPHDFVGVWLNQ